MSAEAGVPSPLPQGGVAAARLRAREADTGSGRGVFAALDLGTNNCRLLVGVPSAGGFRVLDSFSRMVRLGEGLGATGRLGEAAMERTVVALHACAARLGRRPLAGLRAVATEACRQAVNGRAFLERVRAETGLAFEVISAREEAELAVESCADLLGGGGRRALLFDIGGGSTELAWVRLDAPGGRPELIGMESLPFGVVSLAERYAGVDVGAGARFGEMVAEVQGRLGTFEATHRIRQELRAGGVRSLGTSGTVTTLAGVALGLVRYQRPLVDGVELTADAARRAIVQLRRAGAAGLAAHPCVGAERAAFVLPGCAIYAAIQSAWGLPGVTVADRGLREGLLLRLMRAVPSRAGWGMGGVGRRGREAY